MGEAADAAATLVAGVAALVGVLVLAATGSLRAAVPAFLDLALAAGLLHLVGTETWPTIGTVAAVVAIRAVVTRLTPRRLAAVHGDRDA